MKRVSNVSFDNTWYEIGASKLKQTLWYFSNVVFFQNPLNPYSCIKVFMLRLFGAHVGKNVLIKPNVNIKYPWRLRIGDNSWIGENVWIDNLENVHIGNDVCVSQGAMLLTGNHNYKKTTFDLILGPIFIEDGAWIGAKAIVCQHVTCKTHSILTVGSVASTDLVPYGIYRGSPAKLVRKRMINE